jgi:hypothetical protein
MAQEQLPEAALNFTWWVNRKDRSGHNIFEGGFLGSTTSASSIERAAADRRLPGAGRRHAWMALFCQNMLEIAVELAKTDADYADMAVKFVEHFCGSPRQWLSWAATPGMWDEEDGFFYDVLRLPRPKPATQSALDGRAIAPVRGYDL